VTRAHPREPVGSPSGAAGRSSGPPSGRPSERFSEQPSGRGAGRAPPASRSSGRPPERFSAPPSGRLPENLVEDLVDAGSREHYVDAALYDYEYRRRRADVSFYRELARRRGADRILELGAGSGRVTVPLARDGRYIVAVDRSPAMLDRLRDRVARLPAAAASRIEPVAGDLRTFSVGGKFPLAIAAFNVLEHLYTRGEFMACLERIAAHLTPDGAFAFDVQLPDLAWLTRDPSRRWARTRFTDPTTGRAMVYSTNHDYDPVSQIALIRLYYEPADENVGTLGRAAGAGPTVRVVKLSQRKFFPAELEALVAHAGYRVAERYGDFSFRPLDGSAESQVLVCEPVAKRRRKRPVSR
jgi:SAM-dependent methyltransferase